MPRYYVKKDEKWNVFSSIVDDFLYSDFMSFEELKALVIGEVVVEKLKDLKTLLTNRPKLNTMPFNEAMEIIKSKDEPQTHEIRTNTHECVKDTHDKTEPTGYNLSPVDKDINVRSKDERQTEGVWNAGYKTGYDKGYKDAQKVKDSQDLVKDLVKAFCEDGTWLERQGVYTLTLAEAKQRAVDIIESVIAKDEPTTQTETQNSNLTFKTLEYCDICDHKGCEECIANALDEHCMPSQFNKQIEDECAKEYEELGLKELKELIEADRKTESNSEKPNNCEVKNYCDDCLYTDTCDDKAFFYACTSKATISKMEQVEEAVAMSPKEFSEKMQTIAEVRDPEESHIKMDDLMCKLLKSLGYGEGVEIFEDVEKWYS